MGQLIQRQNVHIDHGIFGSPDLDQSGRISAKLQSMLVVPLLTNFTKGEKKRQKTKESHSFAWTAKTAGFYVCAALILSCIVYHVALPFLG